MSKVLIIGAGGVGGVVTHKCAQAPRRFHRNHPGLAHRVEVRGHRGADRPIPVKTAQVDADNVPELVALIEQEQPKLVINVALPYQDLTIMDACLATGVRLPRHRQLRAARRGQVRIQLAVGLPGAFRAEGPHGAARLRLRSRRDQCLLRLARRRHHFDEIHSSTSSTATPATTASPSPPTSTRRSTSARSPPRAATGRTASGWRPSRPGYHARLRLPRGHRPQEIYLMYHEETGIPGQAYPEPQAGPLLDDLLRQLPHAPARCCRMSA